MTAITPKNVHKVLGKHMLVDGFNMVLDIRKSHGSWIHDSKSGEDLLDFFSFFASAPIGCNHPRLANDEFIRKIGEVALNKVTNSDLYTTEMAEFVDTFTRVAIPKYMKHVFFVSGGALGVENALKVAMDWKVRKNWSRGHKENVGRQVLHFAQAFHGRTGYTLSLTNTADPNKTKYFTKFDWPRIVNPKITFPLEGKNLEQVEELEDLAYSQIKKAIKENPEDISSLIIEPIQGEGGDNHFRPEFHQELRRICSDEGIFFILDEVQSGLGLTGKMWAHQHYGIEPDAIAFGKKTQVCGCMVGKRVDEVEDNVFKVSSRINSTWGGNIVDMVRAQRYLEVIEEEKLVENAARQGERLLAVLNELASEHPEGITNVRGRGLMCAFDLRTTNVRNSLLKETYKKRIMLLPAGERSIRFRPPLNISSEEIDEGMVRLRAAIKDFELNNKYPLHLGL